MSAMQKTMSGSVNSHRASAPGYKYVVSLSVLVAALTATSAGTKVSFLAGTQTNYKDRTRVTFGAEAGDGNDFVVTCTQTSNCETAWTATSKKFAVPAGTGGFALEYEIFADSDWLNTDVSYTWGSTIKWFDAKGKTLERTPIDPRFHKNAFTPFRFCGKVPQGAVSATVTLGMDNPNLPPREKVIVRKTAITLFAKGENLPPPIISDVVPPLVYSRFNAPEPNPNLVAKYEIVDASDIDWARFTVSNRTTKAAIPFVHDGNFVTLKPGQPWADGINAIEIRVSDVCGNATVSRKAFLIGEKPKTPVMSLRDDGTALVGGKPIFPIGIFGVSPMSFNCWDLDRAVGDLKRAGLNLMHSYSQGRKEAFMSAVSKHGLISWTYAFWAHHGDKWLVEKSKTDPSVFAWYIGDDTSTYVKPAELLDRDESAHMLDGTRPTCHADTIWGYMTPSRFQPYVNFADIFMPELYPLYAERGNEACVSHVILDMEKVKEEIAKYGDKRPKAIWPIIQVFDGGQWKSYPTPDMLYAMSFASLIHGGNGITWFHYAEEKNPAKKRRYSGAFRTQADWAAFTNLTTRISSLSPVLVERTPAQPPVPHVIEGITKDGLNQPTVTVLVKQHAGATYVLAVNSSHEKVLARIFVSVPDGEGSVEWEDRRVKIVGGAFEDGFAGYGVHVYRF